MSLLATPKFVFDCATARVTTPLGDPIPLVSILWNAGYLELRALHGDGLVERFIKNPSPFVVSLAYPGLRGRDYLVEFQGVVTFPCELPGGEAAVCEVVALCGVRWAEQEGDPNDEERRPQCPVT